MGVTIARTNFAARTTSGDQSITASLGGLTPKLVKFIWSYATTDGTAADGMVRGRGATDGSQQFVVWQYDRHAQASSVSGANNNALNCIRLVNDSGAALATAVFKQWDTNGVTITWTVSTGTAILIEAVFFAGSDYSGDVTSTALTNVVDTAHDVTGPGFEPDIVECHLGNTSYADLSQGYVSNDRASGLVGRVVSFKHRSGRPTTEIYSKLYESTSPCYGGVIATGASADLTCNLEFSAFDASGFTITTRTNAPGTNKVAYTISHRFGSSPVVSSKVYTFSTPTGTGNSTDATPNFTPQYVEYVCTLMEAADTYYDTSLAGSGGICTIDANGQNCITGSSEDAAADSNSQSLSDNVAVNLPLHDGTAGMAATFVSFASTGPTLNWSDIETNAKKWVAFAIQAETSGSQTVNESASLAKQDSISFLHQLDAENTTSQARSLSLSLSEQSDLPESLALSKINDIALDSATVVEESISLTQSRLISQDSQLDIDHPISLTLTPSIELANFIELQEAIDLQESLSLDTNGGAAIEEVITLAKVVNVEISEFSESTESVVVEQINSLSIDSQAEIDCFVDLPYLLSMDSTHDAELQDAISLESLWSIDLLSVADTESTLALSYTQSALVVEEVEGVQESISLARSQSVDLADTLEPLEETLSLAQARAIDIDTDAQASDYTSLSYTLSVSQESIGEQYDSISLDQVKDVQVVASQIIEESITLSYGLSCVEPWVIPTEDGTPLPIVLDAEFGDQLEAVATLELPIQGDLDLATQLQAENTVDLSHAEDIALIDSTVTEESVSLTISEAVDIQETTGDVEESIALSYTQSVDAENNLIAENAVPLQNAHSIGFSEAAIADDYLDLSRTLAATTLESVGEVDESITVVSTRSIDLLHGSQVEDILSTETVLSLEWTDSAVVESVATLEWQEANTFVEESGVIEESITLVQTEGITLSTQLDGQNQLELSNTRTIVLSNDIVTSDSITLQFVETVGVTGSLTTTERIETHTNLAVLPVMEPLVAAESLDLEVSKSLYYTHIQDCQEACTLAVDWSTSLIESRDYEDSLELSYVGAISLLEEHVELGQLPRDILDLDVNLYTTFTFDLYILTGMQHDLTVKNILENELSILQTVEAELSIKTLLEAEVEL